MSLIATKEKEFVNYFLAYGTHKFLTIFGYFWCLSVMWLRVEYLVITKADSDQQNVHTKEILKTKLNI